MRWEPVFRGERRKMYSRPNKALTLYYLILKGFRAAIWRQNGEHYEKLKKITENGRPCNAHRTWSHHLPYPQS